MPTSPSSLCRDCSARAVANGYCAEHQTDNSAAAHKRLFDRSRADDPIRALYRTKRWQGTRRIVFDRDVLCRVCGHCAASECDHVERARLVVEQFGVNAFYDPERCQGLCHGCHSSKTATESGWNGYKAGS